jgi:hypothetical protein
MRETSVQCCQQDFGSVFAVHVYRKTSILMEVGLSALLYREAYQTVLKRYSIIYAGNTCEMHCTMLHRPAFTAEGASTLSGAVHVVQGTACPRHTFEKAPSTCHSSYSQKAPKVSKVGKSSRPSNCVVLFDD